MWSNFWTAGGFGMYPTLLFGFLLLASSVLFLLRPERRYGTLVLGLGAVTFASGLLSCAVGVINSFLYLEQVKPDEQLKIGALGVAESLHNVVLALMIVVVAGLVASAGALRAARAAGAARPAGALESRTTTG